MSFVCDWEGERHTRSAQPFHGNRHCVASDGPGEICEAEVLVIGGRAALVAAAFLQLHSNWRRQCEKLEAVNRSANLIDVGHFD